jgi:predicted N-acetyltransferase YhbS
MLTTVKLEVVEPRTEEELGEYYRLRWERLRKPHGLPLGSEREGPVEDASTHLIAKADGRIVGAACWAVGIRKDQASGKREIYVRYRQLAVDPEFEGRGVGIAMSRHLEREARALGAAEIVGNIRVDRVPYYERLGYVVRGKGETLFETVEHTSMAKPLR